MQEVCGGPEGYKAAYLEKLNEVLASGEDLTLPAPAAAPALQGDGSTAPDSRRVLAQKQPGLYAVAWHPIGGQPDVAVFCAAADAVARMGAPVELRLAPDETAYFVNLTGTQAAELLELTDGDTAHSLFETSVSCIGASICQVGVRDSQALLRASVDAVRQADIPCAALPQVHISGCPSSCGTHQTGAIGFRGAAKVVDKKPLSAFTLYVNGCDAQGQEAMGRELGVILESRVPEFLVKLGHTVADSGLTYAAWAAKDPAAIDAVAAEFLA